MEIECTQRLDSTQEQYTQFEKIEPEQSISRQHAVINVLNSNEFMLMDLDSANKTKVQGKSLQPFIPHPLQNGDMVQFGDVFGVFRLLEDDNDLPMTQAIDIPCTPVPVAKQVSRYGAPSVLVPESPEVSDKDDSFIMPSQPKPPTAFKSPMNKFVKPSKKTVTIQPMGSKKIDNAYWQSGKKSESFNFRLDDSGSSLDDSTNSNRSNKVIDESAENIHEMETQEPYKADDSTDSIYTANTQIPPTPSIHLLETQQPLPDIHGLETQQFADIHTLNTQNVPNIHECATQVPPDILPEVCKVDVQENVQFDLCTANKENDNSIFNAETQVIPVEKETILNKAKKPGSINVTVHETSKEKNDSDDEIVFDEINTQSFHEEFESQPLLPDDVSPQIERIKKIELSSKNIPNKSSGLSDCDDFDILSSQKIATDIGTPSTPKVRKLSGSSTDCDDFDILPTQKIITDIDTLPTPKITNDIDILPTQKITIDDDDLTDCEDEFVNNELMESKKSPDVNFEDMATQVLGDGEIEAELNQNKDQTDGSNKGMSFEELPTQIITDNSKEENFEDMPTQIITEDVLDDGVEINQEVYSEEIISSPFKVPLPTPLKAKKASTLGLTKTSTPVEKKKVDASDPNYYENTQDLFNDLCSQRQDSPKGDLSKPTELGDDELVPCSVEDYEMGDRFRHIENELSPVKTPASGCKFSTPNGNRNENNKHIPKATTSSDVDVKLKTPKTLKIINADLPDSQEIKISVTLKHRSITESSSDTEPEDVSDQDSGNTFGKKKRNKKVNAKLDLTKRFEESIPSRILTRVRKPTYKIQNLDESAKKQNKSILKNSLFDSEDSIDAEIISENISRLKGKSDKKKDKDKNNSKKLSVETQKRPESRNDNKKTDKSVKDSNQAGGSRSSRSKSKKSDESKSKTEHNDDSKDEKNVRSTRSSRSKKDNKTRDSKSDKDKKKKEEDKSDSKSRSRTRNEESKEARSTRSSKSKDKKEKEPIVIDLSPEIVRRSRRQRNKEKTKEIKHENSTVYLSSDTSVDSPKNLKRPASNELEVPSPKRTRSLPTSKTSSVSTTPSVSVCSTPVRSEKHCVLFTAFSNEDVRSKLENLGATIVTDVLACTVLVTMQIKRTFKLLCAVGLGRPIVGPDWVQACADNSTLVDPWLYIIKDSAAEKRFRFSLEGTLRGARSFLRGYNVSSTPSVMPNAQEMKLIVECSGGTWREGGPSWVVVSSTGDRALWPALRRRGARVVSTEFILGGVLRQRPDVEATLFG
ncbi:hypothetical protein MSG28_004544 [Choristoneura fumiferana]|uniref:Uncharacterized protein n=1 Tax=Choristoneura fumiferana TaxID=7141 RepID=A0ACC0K6J9_CHOFU|nr:hypothetical protein MSG28_004544 [Choristoneura fumiferana]